MGGCYIVSGLHMVHADLPNDVTLSVQLSYTTELGRTIKDISREIHIHTDCLLHVPWQKDRTEYVLGESMCILLKY